MARIAGVDLADNWRVIYALTKIKGIGWALSSQILQDEKISEDKRVSGLSSDQIAKIASRLESYATEGDLTKSVRGSIQRLQVTGTYRGLRHSRGLPARGQRTRSNARTKRGKRKTVGSYKKEMLTKMQQTQPKEEK